ncbi:MAG: AAA family ATPase [Planctomycetota bacterium]
MRVVGVYQLKGGVGKTAAAVNLAYLFAHGGDPLHPAPTLLFDLDPQGAATFYFRVAPKVGGGRRVFQDAERLRNAIRASDYPELDLIPADFSYRKLDRDLASADAFAEAIEPLGEDYETLVLDCPPSAGAVAENVFRVADVLLVPTIPTPLSLRTLAQLMAHLKRREGRRPLVLPFFSMVDRRKGLHKRVIDWARDEELGFLEATIPYSAEVERMGVRRSPIFQWAPRCPAALAFVTLHAEIERALSAGSGRRSPLFAKRKRKLLERAGREREPRYPELPQSQPAPMPSPKEIEFKFLVQDADAFERLAEGFREAPRRAPVLQVNHFFDTVGGHLGRAGIALRLRKEGEGEDARWFMTAKGPKDSADPLVAARPEEELEIAEKHARALLAGTASPLEQLAAERPRSPLVARLSAVLGDEALVHVGAFENLRARLGPIEIEADGRTHALLFELDTTRFPGDRTDHEIEVEVRATEDAEALRGHLIGHLARLGIGWSTGDSKLKRFHDALRERAANGTS